MSVFINEYWLEIIFGLISFGLIGLCKHFHGKWKKAVQYDKDAEKAKILEEAKNEADQEVAKATKAIELKIDNLDTSLANRLSQVLYEIETLNSLIEEGEERDEKLEKEVSSLEQHLVSSYRFRLIQLCKIYLAQKYITQDQYDQLTEFFKTYTALGGNGQGKQYYDRAIALPIRSE